MRLRDFWSNQNFQKVLKNLFFATRFLRRNSRSLLLSSAAHPAPDSALLSLFSSSWRDIIVFKILHISSLQLRGCDRTYHISHFHCAKQMVLTNLLLCNEKNCSCFRIISSRWGLLLKTQVQGTVTDGFRQIYSKGLSADGHAPSKPCLTALPAEM